MPATINFLDWRFLTGVASELKSPPSFFRTLLFSRERTYPNEILETHYKTNGVKTAPFVRRDAEAIPVTGRGWRYDQTTFPNIRLKMPFTPNELLDKRRPGTGVYLTRQGEMAKAIQEFLAGEYEQMVEDKDTTIEWMCASIAVNGTISYTGVDEAHWEAAIPRHADLTFTNAAPWSVGTNDPGADITTVKRKMMKRGSAQPNLAILGSTAADTFLSNATVRADLDRRNYSVGSLTLETMFSDLGVRFLGTFHGIPHYEYMAEVDHQGTTVQLVPTDAAIYIHTGAKAVNRLTFGPIPEMKLLTSGRWQKKIFSKSWQQEDPSQLIRLIHTRPFPWMRAPNTIAKVTIT